MALPAAATKNNLDQSTDDPKLARAELASLVDKLNEVLTHLGLSSITSTPLAIGSGLESNTGALRVKTASTTQSGIAELAADAEAIAKSDTSRVLTPKNLAALVSSDTVAGLVELATNAEALEGTDAARAITAAALAHVLANSGDSIKTIKRFEKTVPGTYIPSAGMAFCIVEVQAPGGGAGSPTGANFKATAGANSGAYGISLLTAAQIGVSRAYIIGAAGLGGSSGGNGTDGGNASFSTFIICTGGKGSLGVTGGTVPTIILPDPTIATSTSADENISGNQGSPAHVLSTTLSLSGKGADSKKGNGGYGISIRGTPAKAGKGAGGAGGNTGNSSSPANGGDGGDGIIIITEYCTQ